jgi:O-antigen/teichoic acid export membrane protein
MELMGNCTECVEAQKDTGVGARSDVTANVLGGNLRANFLWTFAGNTIHAACQWGMLVALARLGSAQMVGEFALALAIASPVLMFANLQLRGVQATDARREFVFRDYLGLRLLTTAAALAVIAGLAAFTSATSIATLAILLIGTAKALESISDLYYGFFQQHERMDRIARSLILRGALSLALLAAVVGLTASLAWGSTALVLTALVVLGMVDYRGAAALAMRGEDGFLGSQDLSPRWQAKPLWRLARLAFPLGMVMFIVSLSTNVPRYYVEHYCGLGALGVFAALAYVMVAGSRIVMALGDAASPRLARHYAAGARKEFGTLLLQLVLCGALLGGGAVATALVAGPELLTFCYGPEYAEHANLFVWIAAAGALGYVGSFVGYGMTAARQFFVQMPLFIVVGLATAAACALLVPDYGLIGAAWAMGVGAFVQLAGSALVIGFALAASPGEERHG